MTASAVATRADIDDILEVIQVLAESVARRFDAVDQRFEALESRIDQRFEALESRTDQRFDRVYSILDGMTGRHDTTDSEQTAVGYKLDRHERWIRELADKTGHKLNP